MSDNDQPPVGQSSASEHNRVSSGSYRDITNDIREQSLARHERRITAIKEKRSHLRQRLFAKIGGVLLLLCGGLVLYSMNQPVPPENPPEDLSLWIQQQAMLKQVAQAQQWIAQGEAQSDMPPPENLEDLQEWLDQIKLSPDLQKLEEDAEVAEDGFVPFQCPVTPIPCNTDDVPSAKGDTRIELSHLVRNANAMLADNGKCEDTANMVGEYASMFGWRKSEGIVKSLVELSVARCFTDAGNYENAEVHFQRAYCASITNPDPHQAMNALYGLAKLSATNDNTESLQGYIACSESLLDYHTRTGVDLQTLHNFVTLSLMHYEFAGDAAESIRLEEKALASVKELAASAPESEQSSHLDVMMTLQMNLMEGYLTLGNGDKMWELHEELKSNPKLEDGDRLIARGMLIMQDIADGNNDRAIEHLDVVIKRYQSLAEFTTIWSWEAFDRWMEESRNSRTDFVHDSIHDLRLILTPERPTDSLQTLYRIRADLQRR